MLRRLVLALVLSMSVLLSTTLPASSHPLRFSQVAQTAEGSFTESFDGAPTAPQAWRPSTWDVTVHTRDQRYDMAPMAASHGADCAGPPATHTVALVADAVFLCRNHLMTAINDPGYGMIYLTPNQLVDFSAGEAVVRFDLSTLRASGRDWADIWISPYQDHLQLALEDWIPDGQGEPRRGVHIRMEVTDKLGGGTFFFATVVRDHQRHRIAGLDIPYESLLTPDPARRDTFELRISRTHLRFGLPQYNLWWVDTPVADLGWDQGVVQLGHHAYNPTKCESCAPNTWHWDNVQISPAVPFTMVAGVERFADATRGTIQLLSATTEEGRLRFTGYGQRIEYSVDGGQSWQVAPRTREKNKNEYSFHSYWVKVPAGITAVQFRGQGDPIGNPWLVRDLSVWSGVSEGPSASQTERLFLPKLAD